MIAEKNPITTRTWIDFLQAWTLFFQDNGVDTSAGPDAIMQDMAWDLYTGKGFVYKQSPDPWRPAKSRWITVVLALEGRTVICCGRAGCDRDLSDKLNRLVHQFIKRLQT